MFTPFQFYQFMTHRAWYPGYMNNAYIQSLRINHIRVILFEIGKQSQMVAYILIWWHLNTLCSPFHFIWTDKFITFWDWKIVSSDVNSTSIQCLLEHIIRYSSLSYVTIFKTVRCSGDTRIGSHGLLGNVIHINTFSSSVEN